MAEPTQAEVEAASKLVLAEWLNAVDTEAITDAGDQRVIYAAMSHMTIAVARMVAKERGRRERLDAAITSYMLGDVDGAEVSRVQRAVRGA